MVYATLWVVTSVNGYDQATSSVYTATMETVCNALSTTVTFNATTTASLNSVSRFDVGNSAAERQVQYLW